MNDEIPISVVVPTFKRTDWLLALLESLNIQKNVVEVICVDDDSPNGEEKKQSIVERSWNFKLTYLSQKKAGPATARNRGINIAESDFIALLDDDVVVYKDWSEKILSAFTDDSIGGVTGKTLSFKNETLSERFLVHQEHLHKHQFNSDGSLSYVCTANSAFRKKALLECTGFTETIPFAAGDDMDLGFKLKKLGYNFGYSENAIALHRQRETMAELWRLFFISGKGAYLCAQMHQDLTVEHVTSKKLMNPAKVFSVISEVPRKMLRNLHNPKLKKYEGILFPMLEIVNHFLYQFGRFSEYLKKKKNQ